MKFKYLLSLSLLLVIFAALSTSALTNEQDLIGYRHKGVKFGEKLPNGAKDLGGGLLFDENYGVTRFSKGKKQMLWLEKIVEMNEDGVPNWEVKDVLIFKNHKKNQEFLFSYSSPCQQDGAENLDLIVLAKHSSGTKNYRVLKAWVANVETEKFEQISTRGIACQ